MGEGARVCRGCHAVEGDTQFWKGGETHWTNGERKESIKDWTEGPVFGGASLPMRLSDPVGSLIP